MSEQDPVTLALETSAGQTSAAVMYGGELFTAPALSGPGQAERLFGLIADVLASAGMSYGRLARIAVTTGPGSFSGVRSGLSAARGLTLALDIPIVAVTTFDLLAFQRRNSSGVMAGDFAIVIPAGRSGVYMQCFTANGAALSLPAALTAAEALSMLPPSIINVIGPAAAELMTAWAGSERPPVMGFETVMPDAASLARLSAAAPVPASPSPLYIRPADARPQQSKILPRADT